MAFDLAGTITGASVYGLTSPTYTLVEDRANDTNARQFYVSALGGTQAGVNLHNMRQPFTLTAWRPRYPAKVPKVNPMTGLLMAASPDNVTTMLLRTAVRPITGEPYVPMSINTAVRIPSGGEVTDIAQVRAAISLFAGVLMAKANEFAYLTTHGQL
jgi:hypothetical protein